MTPCCDVHDRMDKIMHSDECYDPQCGTPTAPRGERRYCCGKCPQQSQPLRLKAVWASNPMLMSQLRDDEYAQVFALAIEAGPKHVDIQTAVPAPAAGVSTLMEPSAAAVELGAALIKLTVTEAQVKAGVLK